MEEQIPVSNKNVKQNEDSLDLSEPEQQPSAQFQAPPKEKKPGKGTKVLLVLLLLVLLAGSAYGAYWYGQEQVKKENQAKINELQEQIDDANATVKDGALNLNNVDEGYLVIKQWSVKLKSTESAMSYSISNGAGNNGEPDQSAKMTNRLIDAISGCDGKQHVTLLRYSTKPSNPGPYVTFINEIDKYYYYVSYPDGGG